MGQQFEGGFNWSYTVALKWWPKSRDFWNLLTVSSTEATQTNRVCSQISETESNFFQSSCSTWQEIEAVCPPNGTYLQHIYWSKQLQSPSIFKVWRQIYLFFLFLCPLFLYFVDVDFGDWTLNLWAELRLQLFYFFILSHGLAKSINCLTWHLNLFSFCFSFPEYWD